MLGLAFLVEHAFVFESIATFVWLVKGFVEKFLFGVVVRDG